MEALRGRCVFVSGMWMLDCYCYGTLQTTLITMFGCNRGELQYQACASYLGAGALSYVRVFRLATPANQRP